jgi:hypothetical protein
MFVVPVGKYPCIRGGLLLIADKGVLGFAGDGVLGVNGYAVTARVINKPGFLGGFAAGKYPADFDFSLLCDEGGIFEYFKYRCYAHFLFL